MSEIQTSHDPTQSLISTYDRSATRTRHVLIIYQLFSIVLIIGAFNHHFTWLRRVNEHFIDKLTPLSVVVKTYNGVDSIPNETIRLSLDQSTLKDLFPLVEHLWSYTAEQYGSQKFSDFNSPGENIYVQDLPFLGSLALIAILLWFLFSIRRTSGIMYELREKSLQAKDFNTIESIYFGSSFSQIFNTIDSVDNVDEPIRYGKRILRRIVKNINLLIYIPIVVFVMFIAWDALETFTHAINKEPIWYNDSCRWDNGVKAEVLTRSIVPVLMVIFCLFLVVIIKNLFRKEKMYWKDIVKLYRVKAGANQEALFGYPEDTINQMIADEDKNTNGDMIKMIENIAKLFKKLPIETVKHLVTEYFNRKKDQ